MSGEKTNCYIQSSTGHWPVGDYVTSSKTASCDTPPAVAKQQEQCNDSNIQDKAASMTTSTTPKTHKRKTKWMRDQTGFGHVTTASLANMQTYTKNSDQFSVDELQQFQDDAIRLELPSDN
eukprot:10658508-Ditylum_brightwellii.AAC.1